MTKTSPSKFIRNLAFIAVVIFFGSSWLGNKIALDQHVPPFYAAAIRFSIAAVLMCCIWIIRPNKPKINKDIIKLILMYGLIMIATVNAMTFWSMQYLSSSLTSIIFSIYPILIMLLSHVLLKDDKMDTGKIIGMLVAFMGVVILFYNKDLFTVHKQEFLAMIVMFISTAANAVPNVLFKRTIEKTDLLTLTAGGMFVGAAALWILAIFVEGPPVFELNSAIILSELYLGIICSSAGFFLYFWLLKWMKVSTLSLTGYLTPIVAIILGLILYNEHLPLQQIMGMCFIFSGIYLTRKKSQKAL